MNLILRSTERTLFHRMPELVAATPAVVADALGPFPHLSARSVSKKARA